MTFKNWIDRVGWALLTGVVVFSANQLKEMASSVAQLNTNVAVIVERVRAQEQTSSESVGRISNLEKRVTVLEYR